MAEEDKRESRVHWLFYSSLEDEVADGMEAGLKRWAGAERVDVCHGIERLNRYLSTPHRVITHALVICFTQPDLRSLAEFREQIKDWRLLIAVAGPKSPETIAEALRLRPRFVAQLPEEMGHLEQVVVKMMRNSRIAEPGASVQPNSSKVETRDQPETKPQDLQRRRSQ
jgi:hypothetical protein